MSRSENKNIIMSKIENNGKAFFYMKGISMLPMLKQDRDISILAPIPAEPKRGDVVLFVRPDKEDELVLHRIIRQQGNVFIIRGDNTYHDETVKKENVLAILKGFFRKGRYFDCETSRIYHFYTFCRMFFYPVRRFLRYDMRVAGAKIKNDIFHLNNLRFGDIFGRK